MSAIGIVSLTATGNTTEKQSGKEAPEKSNCQSEIISERAGKRGGYSR